MAIKEETHMIKIGKETITIGASMKEKTIKGKSTKVEITEQVIIGEKTIMINMREKQKGNQIEGDQTHLAKNKLETE